MKKITIFLIGIIAFLGVGYTYLSTSVAAFTPFSNGFEVDTDGWLDSAGTITRVPSGDMGIPSSEGSNHAVIDGGVFTRWGGYESVFPTNGYITEVDVYLDMSMATGSNDDKFDFSSAINNPAGDHRRDFIFSLGTNPSVADEWLISASNNAPGWPGNPGRDPFTIDETGWYTLRHTFMDDSGVLSVLMELLDSDDNVLHSWTLSNPSDIIGTTVGGNRYGWFVGYAFEPSYLAIDSSAKYEVDVEAPVVMIDSPLDGEIVSGTVDIYGTVMDANPWRYYLMIFDASNATVAGPGTVYESESFSNEMLFSWDTTTVDDGVYEIRLAARDTFNNRDDSVSLAKHFVQVANHTPVEKDQCKQGGWVMFDTPTFKNQGDCVSFVQSNEKALGNKDK